MRGHASLGTAADDEPLLNIGRALPTGRVRELIDIVAALEPSEDEEEAGPVLYQP